MPQKPKPLFSGMKGCYCGMNDEKKMKKFEDEKI
jgi:hypothetical protein